MKENLKSYQYYSDLYDRHTVDTCRRIEKLHKSDKVIQKVKSKVVDYGQSIKISIGIKNLHVYFVTGERYLNKSKIIREWMDNDQRKDELYESAEAPKDVRCLSCRNLLKPTFKELWSRDSKEDRVLFMYDCPNKCLPRRAFFSDGEEWRIKPNLCPKCNNTFDHESKDDNKKITTIYTCKGCVYSKSEEFLLMQKEDEGVDDNFAKDRDRFCLTDEDGQKFQNAKSNLEGVTKLLKELKEKEDERKEKLKKYPKGFYVEGVGYTCPICRNNTHEGDNWYDKWGIKCLTCQKAIDEKEIPASLAKNQDIWYTKYDIQSSFNVKTPTINKWVRTGVLKVRTVSRYGKGVHAELFLIEDNKDFLPPKKLVESRSVTEIKDGVQWSHSESWYNFVNPYEHLKGYKIMDYLEFTDKKDDLPNNN